ncbi:MAG TPA: fibronectin-binding protein [Spirochaetota bacterium]|nr:fibronectin-binding protein [Spirochaetota bacterium]
MKKSRRTGMMMACAAVAILTFHNGTVNAQAPVIEGVYRVTGTNPNGTSYTGMVTIGKDGDMYRFHWKVGTEYYGHGTLRGDVLTVYWGAPDPVIYTVKDGGRTLEGLWAGGAATETLRR